MIRKKKNMYYIIVLLVACLGIGYAYLTTTLSINGITDIDRNNWDVYFDNIAVTSGSVTGSQVIDAAEVVNDTTVEFHINLKKPGDFYEFTVDAKNDGTLDAMIDTVEKKLNGATITILPAYLDYTVTYDDDVPILNNQILASETTETFKVRVEYKKNISANDLPSTAQELELSFGVEYIQADESASVVREIIYDVSGYDFMIGSPVPENATTYSNYIDAVNAVGYNAFAKHIVSNGIVVKSFAGFVINSNAYYLPSTGATYNEEEHRYNNDSKYYNSNKEIIRAAFGESNCHEDVYEDHLSYYICRSDTYDLYVETGTNGFVTSRNNWNTYLCNLNEDGSSFCGSD